MSVRPFAISHSYNPTREDAFDSERISTEVANKLSAITKHKVNIVFTTSQGHPKIHEALFFETNYSRDFEIKFSKQIETSLIDLFNNHHHCIGFLLSAFESYGLIFKQYHSLIYSGESCASKIAKLVLGESIEIPEETDISKLSEWKDNPQYFRDNEWRRLKNGWQNNL